jgi:hypothetical protein
MGTENSEFAASFRSISERELAELATGTLEERLAQTGL